MKYIDLHTDALTKEGVLSVTKETLGTGGCFLECFACFTPRGDLEKTLKLCDKFEKMCARDNFQWVKSAGDLSENRVNAMLTVEGGEAVGNDLKNLHILYEKGVRMMTLVWNYDNAIGTTHKASPLKGEAPAERVAGGTHGGRAVTYAPTAHSERSEESHRLTDFVRGDSSVALFPQNERTSTDFVRGDSSVALFPQNERTSTDFVRGDSSVALLPQNERRPLGLTPFGRDVVEKMGELGMIVDVSHGSDALFFDVADWSKRSGIPFVASHSNARACHFHTRNLDDGQIRTLADCGGVMGLNFYDEFLSDDKTAAGQKRALIAHITHILKVGGEDALAFGSDFDGIPQNAYMKTAADMPRLIEAMCDVIPPRVVEKIAFRNAERVIRAVCSC